jgi:hypothetical protein
MTVSRAGKVFPKTPNHDTHPEIHHLMQSDCSTLTFSVTSFFEAIGRTA